MATEPITDPIGNDLIEAADAKSKVKVIDDKPTSDVKDTLFTPYKKSMAIDYLPRFTLPNFYAETQFVEIESVNMTVYFGSLRTSLLFAIYPDGHFGRNTAVTEAAFSNVCRTLIKARCDYVYAAVNGTAHANSISYPIGMKVPASLALIINGIGVTSICSGSVPICPLPETQNQFNQINTLATSAHFIGFTRLVADAESKNVIRTAQLSLEITGSPWYTLGVIEPIRPIRNEERIRIDLAAAQEVNRNIQNANQLPPLPRINALGMSDTVYVRACHNDVTPDDINLAVIVQRDFNGIIPFVSATTEFHATIPDALSRRELFHIGA